tara:strand:- start:27437 stop:27664 length:228 start_codon:yes stop_codon:yes gene_type:complete
VVFFAQKKSGRYIFYRKNLSLCFTKINGYQYIEITNLKIINTLKESTFINEDEEKQQLEFKKILTEIKIKEPIIF